MLYISLVFFSHTFKLDSSLFILTEGLCQDFTTQESSQYATEEPSNHHGVERALTCPYHEAQHSQYELCDIMVSKGSHRFHSKPAGDLGGGVG
jgi:hypothetical protein